MEICTLPLYCSDACRSDLERSLVKRMYDASEAAAEVAGYADFAEFDSAVRADFAARLRAATVGPSSFDTRIEDALLRMTTGSTRASKMRCSG